MDIMLTEESKRVLKSLYDIYLGRRESGSSKSAAVRFDDPMSGGPQIAGLDEAMQELSNAGFIRCFITGDYDLTDEAIIFMEKANNISEHSSQIPQNRIINTGSGNITFNNSAVGSHQKVSASESPKGIRWAKIGVIVAIIVGIATVAVTVLSWAFS